MDRMAARQKKSLRHQENSILQILESAHPVPKEGSHLQKHNSQVYKDIEHSIDQSKLRDSESLESTLKNSTLQVPYYAYNDSTTIDIVETRSRTLHQLEKQRRHSTIEYGGSH